MEARVVVAVAWFRLSRLVRCSSVRNLYSLSLTYSIGLHLSISLSLSLLLIWSPFISLASLFHARTLSLTPFSAFPRKLTLVPNRLFQLFFLSEANQAIWQLATI